MTPSSLVIIGASLGGLSALEAVIRGLPQDYALPLVVVQHRHRGADDALSLHMQRYTPLTVQEVEDKEPLKAGHVYLAPADYHLLIEPGSLALSTEGPVNNARPSIDVALESAADAYGPRLMAVILTGASRDGAKGAARVKARGGVVAVQDPATAESPIMPRAILQAAQVDHILSLEGLAALIEGFGARRTPPAPRGAGGAGDLRAR